jgi:hypothetical protein
MARRGCALSLRSELGVQVRAGVHAHRQPPEQECYVP